MTFWFYSIPLIAAFIGYIFNWLAFRFFVNHYINHRKKVIVAILAEKAAQLLPLSAIENKISDGALIEKAMPMIETHIDEFLTTKLPQEIPMLSMFVGNKTTDKIKEVFITQLRNLFPKVMGSIVNDFKNTLNIQEQITAELENANIKTLVAKAMKDPAQKFAWAGFILSMLVSILSLLFFHQLS